jgi:serine/threonine-protein kinase
MTEAQASEAVKARFLTLAPVTRTWSDTVPEGTVVSFTPKSGQQLKRDGIVHVVISKGPEPIRIPSYIDQNADHATVELKALGFVVTPVPVYNDTVPAGTVIDQTPHDATGFKGDHVRLVVSRGPHLVKVPDVYHNGTAAAEQRLTDAGFHYQVKQYTPNFGLGFVVVQSPSAGDMAPYGSTVVIYIV